MPLNDFLNHRIVIEAEGRKTSLLKPGASIKVIDTDRAWNSVKRLGIEASGFDTQANQTWNAVREAIYVDVEGSSGIIVGRLNDIDGNDGHTFVITRTAQGFKVTINWRLQDGSGVGGGPPEDSDQGSS